MATESDQPARLRGRGGIGNYHYAQQNVTEAGAAEDLEAQGFTSRTDLSLDSRPVQDYTPTGRGGIGNYYTPSDLVGVGDSASKAGELVQRNGTSGGARYSGRGGAGNFTYSDQCNAKTTGETIAENAKKRHDEVVRDVELGLRQPEKAYLGSDGRGEDLKSRT